MRIGLLIFLLINLWWQSSLVGQDQEILESPSELQGNMLKQHEMLLQGVRLYNPNRHCFIHIDDAGTLKIEHQTEGVLWSTGGNQNPSMGQCSLLMNPDGVLELVDTSALIHWQIPVDGRNHTPITPGLWKPVCAKLEMDCTLSLWNSSDQRIWSSRKGSLTGAGYVEQTLNPIEVTLQKWEGNTLLERDTLRAGEQLFSPSKHFFLTIQRDGNMVIYDRSRHPIWSTGTWGNGDHCQFSLSKQGLQLKNRFEDLIWEYPFSEIISSCQLYLEDSGHLVLKNSDGKIQWKSLTGDHNGGGEVPD